MGIAQAERARAALMPSVDATATARYSRITQSIGLPTDGDWHWLMAREARVVFAPLTRLPSCSAERRLGLIDGETQVGVIQFKEQIAGMNKLAVHNKDALDRATNQRRHLRDRKSTRLNSSHSCAS